MKTSAAHKNIIDTFTQIALPSVITYQDTDSTQHIYTSNQENVITIGQYTFDPEVLGELLHLLLKQHPELEI